MLRRPLNANSWQRSTGIRHYSELQKYKPKRIAKLTLRGKMKGYHVALGSNLKVVC